ncbi:MAG: hypothetical protein ACREN2_05730 [Candidatus Dormibacteria bacterium]
MTSTALVGPLPTIHFQHGLRSERQVYAVPRDTMDQRYATCAKHHPACDCREAELAEQLGEYRSQHKAIERAAARLLVGHRLHDYGDAELFAAGRTREELGDELWWRYMVGDGPLACQCTGCQLARAGHLQVWALDNGIVTPDAEEHVR